MENHLGWHIPTDSSRPLHPDPNAVTITSCVSTSGGYGVILTWSCPLGGYEAFELQVGGQQSSQDRSSCERGVSVAGLQPARSYPVTVTTVWAGMRAPPAAVTCHTQSAGEQSPRGQAGTVSVDPLPPSGPCREGVFPTHGVLFVCLVAFVFCFLSNSFIEIGVP